MACLCFWKVKKRENCLITYNPRLQVSCLWNCRPSHEVSVCTSQNDNQFDKAKETLSTFSKYFGNLLHKIQWNGTHQMKRVTRWRPGVLHWTWAGLCSKPIFPRHLYHLLPRFGVPASPTPTSPSKTHCPVKKALISHMFILSSPLTEHLLCSWHSSRHWGYIQASFLPLKLFLCIY